MKNQTIDSNELANVTGGFGGLFGGLRGMAGARREGGFGGGNVLRGGWRGIFNGPQARGGAAASCPSGNCGGGQG